LKKVISVAAGFILSLRPEFAGLLFFLWMFWESVGNLTVRTYDDYQVTKTEKALKASLSANVDGYYVHMLTVRSVHEREHRGIGKLILRSRIRAVYTAIAWAFS
jgi:hypothetical protein